MNSWEPFLSAFGKYSWRSFVGVFAASAVALFIGPQLGLSAWLAGMRPWLILAFASSGAILLTYIITFIYQQISSRDAKSKVHFVVEPLNTGWSRQNDRQINVRITGTFTLIGPNSLLLLNVLLKNKCKASNLGIQVWSYDMYGDSRYRQRSELSLNPGEAEKVYLEMKFDLALGQPGQPLTEEFFLRDNQNRDYSVGKVTLPYIGR